MSNVFEIRDDPQEERRFREGRQGNQRLGMVAAYVFSRDLDSVCIGFSTKTRSYKPFGGGIEEMDRAEHAHDVHRTAINAITREVREESAGAIVPERLRTFTDPWVVGVDDEPVLTSYVRLEHKLLMGWGGINLFFAILRAKMSLRAVEVQEDGGPTRKFCDQDYWPLENVLLGEHRDLRTDDPNNKFNPHYRIGLIHALREMRQMDCIKQSEYIVPLVRVIESLENHRRGNLLSDEYLKTIEEQIARENEERRKERALFRGE